MLGIAAVLTLQACGHATTAPTATTTTKPWYYGTWDAVSVDGVPMPSRIGTTVYSDFTFSGGVLFNRFSITQTDRGSLVACLGNVNALASANTLATTFDSAVTGACATSYFTHAFVQDADDDGVMVTQWEGHTIVLVKD